MPAIPDSIGLELRVLAGRRSIRTVHFAEGLQRRADPERGNRKPQDQCRRERRAMYADRRAPSPQAELVRRLAARLEATPYGAELPALADSNQDALKRSECERG
jgi:hypothetical protein